MQFGNKIYELRKNQGLTQEQLAGELGISTAAVSKWETGASLPDIIMLCSIADYFQVSTDVLLGRKEKSDFYVADDADFICATLKELLEREGYMCSRTFNNGLELLNTLKADADNHLPTGIFLDIHMPEMDGLSALKEIRTLYPGIKTVLVTADTSDEVRKQAYMLGVDAFVTKPFLPHHITAALKDIL